MFLKGMISETQTDLAPLKKKEQEYPFLLTPAV